MLLLTQPHQAKTLNTTILHLRYPTDTAICYATTSSYTAISLSWSRDTAILQLRYPHWYRNMLYYALPQQSSCTNLHLWYSNPHSDPHNDTTICYDNIPLIIQKSTCSDTNTTAIPQIRYLSDITNTTVQLIHATCSKGEYPTDTNR